MTKRAESSRASRLMLRFRMPAGPPRPCAEGDGFGSSCPSDDACRSSRHCHSRPCRPPANAAGNALTSARRRGHRSCRERRAAAGRRLSRCRSRCTELRAAVTTGPSADSCRAGPPGPASRGPDHPSTRAEASCRRSPPGGPRASACVGLHRPRAALHRGCRTRSRTRTTGQGHLRSEASDCADAARSMTRVPDPERAVGGVSRDQRETPLLPDREGFDGPSGIIPRRCSRSIQRLR